MMAFAPDAGPSAADGLVIEHLSLAYGAHLAIDEVALKVAPKESVVILGANGAGKSSLLKAIIGMARPKPGSRIFYAGQDLISVPSHRIVERGIAAVPEGRGVFTGLTVAENLALGAIGSDARNKVTRRREEVYALFPRLAERRSQPVGLMSGGEQQMVAIGRALMSRPKLLLLDEPSLGLAPIVVGELFATLAKVRENGVGILVVEQNVRTSLDLVDRGYVMEAGRIVGEGSAVSLADDPVVRKAFLGG